MRALLMLALVGCDAVEVDLPTKPSAEARCAREAVDDRGFTIPERYIRCLHGHASAAGDAGAD